MMQRPLTQQYVLKHTPKPQRGLSLVSLMVGILIGTFMIAANLQLLVIYKNVYNQIININSLYITAANTVRFLQNNVGIAGYGLSGALPGPLGLTPINSTTSIAASITAGNPLSTSEKISISFFNPSYSTLPIYNCLGTTASATIAPGIGGTNLIAVGQLSSQYAFNFLSCLGYISSPSQSNSLFPIQNVEHMRVLIGVNDRVTSRSVTRYVKPDDTSLTTATNNSLANVISARISFIIKSDQPLNVVNSQTTTLTMPGMFAVYSGALKPYQYTTSSDKYMYKAFTITIPFKNYIPAPYPSLQPTVTNPYGNLCIQNPANPTNYILKIGGVKSAPTGTGIWYKGSRCCVPAGFSDPGNVNNCITFPASCVPLASITCGTVGYGD